MYRISDYVMGAEFDKGYVILNTETGYYYELNHVGAEIWQMLVKGRSAHAIVDALALRYEIPRDILEKDFQDLVHELKTNGILEEIDEGPSNVADASNP